MATKKKDIKKSFSKETSKKLPTFKNNSSFKRAMGQVGVKSGEKVIFSYSDGTTYTVECS